jgi:hypothetical protein
MISTVRAGFLLEIPLVGITINPLNGASRFGLQPTKPPKPLRLLPQGQATQGRTGTARWGHRPLPITLRPNPAKVPSTFQRLPNHAGLHRPVQSFAVNVAGGKRACQPAALEPADSLPGAALAPRDTRTKLWPGAVFRSVSNSAETRTSAVASTIQSGPPQPIKGPGRQ